MTKEITGKKKREPKIETKIRFEKVLDLMLSWAKNPKDNNIWSYVPMSMKEAVKEEWMTEQNFIYYINTYPALKEKYEAVRRTKREVIWNIAENNLKNALEDEKEIDKLDKAKLSLDYLKSTEKSYNQKIEVNQTTKSLNFNISDDELKARIYDLMEKLW